MQLKEGSYHLSHLTLSYLISTDLTAFELSAIIGSGHGKLGHALEQASSLWLRPITAHSVQMK